MESCIRFEFVNNKQPDRESNFNNNLHGNEDDDSEWMYSNRNGNSNGEHHRTNSECRQ